MGMFDMVTALQHDSPSTRGGHWQIYPPIDGLYFVYLLNSGNWIALLPKGSYPATTQMRSVTSLTCSTPSQWHLHK